MYIIYDLFNLGWSYFFWGTKYIMYSPGIDTRSLPLIMAAGQQNPQVCPHQPTEGGCGLLRCDIKADTYLYVTDHNALTKEDSIFWFILPMELKCSLIVML